MIINIHTNEDNLSNNNNRSQLNKLIQLKTIKLQFENMF